MGAVSPDTRPTANINPVMMLGNAMGNVTFQMFISGYLGFRSIGMEEKIQELESSIQAQKGAQPQC
jgi:hypothetical protein